MPSLRRPRVAIGFYADWADGIAAQLDSARFDAAFADLAAIDLDAFDAAVPLQVEHYAPLALRPDLRGRRFWRPDESVCALCDDKLALTRWLVERGYGDHAPALRAPGPPYPYVWKGRAGAWGEHVRMIHSAEDEAGLDMADPAWFAQELTPGSDEYAAHFLRARGRIVYAALAGYRMAAPDRVRGGREQPLGTGFKAGVAHSHVFAQILGDLDYEGTACFNYKLARGRPMIFEINPRYGASLGNDINGYLQAYLAALGP